MKIKKNVREQYMKLCWISSSKCESFRDIEDKIIRAVRTGRLLKTEDGKQYINYYHNCFVVKNGKVIDMFIDRENYWYVKEHVKINFDRKHQKIVV
ncbi:hypothetical protein D3C87_766500 [compost metagenome]